MRVNALQGKTLAWLFMLMSISLLVIPWPALALTATTLGDYDNITVMQVSGSYDVAYVNGSPDMSARQAIAREFYRTHGDDYDMLVIFTNFDFVMPPAAKAFFSPARNNVRGIGLALTDSTRFYSPDSISLTRLEGTIDMANLASHAMEPTAPEFDDTLTTLTHEFVHRWGAYVHFIDGTTESAALLGSAAAHWSYLLDSGGSTLYGNNWRNNGDGTFTAIAPEQAREGEPIGRIFSPLDLYLMGLIDKTQVPPLLLIDAPGVDKTQLPTIGETIAGVARIVTIDDIIAAEGERSPSAANARKEFNVAFIYAVTPGTWSANNAEDRGEVAAINRFQLEWEKRFSILTDGTALMRTTLVDPEPADTNPGLPTPTDPPAVAPSVTSGVSWLVSRQQPGGFWQDQSGTERRDTAAAVAALKLFPAGAGAAANGQAWLGTVIPENSDFLARKLLSLNSASIAELVLRQNADGGWGSVPGYGSNPVDTALVLQVLAIYGGADSGVLTAAVNYLHGKQNPDGGWNTGRGGSMVQSTAQALLALNSYRGSYPIEPVIADGLAWLIAKQNGDGGFGNSPSTVIDTALALQALKATGGSQTAGDNALNWLLTQQADNGSWNSSIFQTAGAVAALYAGQVGADLVVATADITCAPALVATVPAEITVTVNLRNLGSNAVSQAAVSLYDGDPALGRLLGTQCLDVAGHGAALAGFAVTISEFGLREFHVVIDGDNLVAEPNEWNNEAVKILAVNLPPPVIGFAASESSGSEACSSVPLAVILSYPWFEPITVNYVVNAGTARPSADYVPLSGSLTIAAGETGGSINLAIINDLLAECDKTVSVELAVPDIGSLGTARHLYTIRDDEAPAVSITSPSNGVTGLNRPRLLYTTTGSSVVVRVDGVVVGKVSGDTLDRLADGMHAIEVTAANSFGVTTISRVDFTVDTALPTVVIHEPSPGTVSGPQPRLDYAVTSTVRQEILMDGVVVDKGPGDLLGPLTDGMHTLSVNVWNATGAKSSALVVFQVDARPPRVEIIYPSNEYVREDSPVLLCSSDEPGVTTVWLDGIETAIAVGEPLGPLASGVHRLRVTVTDALGNVGSDEVFFAVSIAGEPPYQLVAGWPVNVEGSYGGITADRSGNLYVVTRRAEKELDIAKYDPAGRQLWRVVRSSSFNVIGSHYVDFEPKDIAVDSQGNLYVAGWGYSISRFYSFLAKYDANGNYVKHVLYDTGMLFGDVQAYSVHVDANDQVYVSGITDYDLFSINYQDPAVMFVAKYDRNLSRLQARCFGDSTGLASFQFESRDAMTVDGNENVWITGRNWYNQLLVWKLAPDLTRTGVEITGVAGSSGLDIDADPFGNSYVAGNGPTGGTLWKFQADGSPAAAPVKVSPFRLNSLIAGDDGGVTVVDNQGTVTRLDRELAVLWSVGLGGSFDAKLVADRHGRLYVGGREDVASPASVARLADPRHPRFDFDRPVFYANGSLAILSGYLDSGYEVILESAGGNLVDYRHEADSGLWRMAIAGLPEGESLVAVAVTNAAGFAKRYETCVVVDTTPPKVVITAPANGSVWTSRPVLTYTVDAGEVLVFVNGVDVTRRSGYLLDSLRPGVNRIRVQSVDLAGNAGFAEVAIQAAGAAVGEAPLGITGRWKVAMNGNQRVVDSREDAAGHIYLFGDTESSRDLYVAKFDPVGNLLDFWTFDSGSFGVQAAALAVKPGGDFAIAYNVRPPGNPSIQVHGYAADGTTRLWSDVMSSGSSDAIHGLTVDAAGNLYLCGETQGRLNNKKYGGNGDYFLIKYTPQGNRLWTVLSNTPTADSLLNIEAGNDGFLYGMGRMTNATAMTLFKFDPNGALLWSVDYLYPLWNMNAMRMRRGRDGSLYTLLERWVSEFNYDYHVVKHDAQGSFVTSIYAQAPALRATGLSLDLWSNVYVTGSTGDPYGWGWTFAGHRGFGDEDIFVAKYAATDLRMLSTSQLGDVKGQRGSLIIFSRVSGQGFLAGVEDGDFTGTSSSGQDLFLAPLTPMAGSSVPELTVTEYRSPTMETFQVVKGHGTIGAILTATLAAPAGSMPIAVPVAQRSDGSWQITVAGLAANADNTLVVSAATDFGTTGRVVTIAVDTLSPLLTVDPVLSPTKLTMQTITGRAEPGATLTMSGMSPTIPVVNGAWSHVVDDLREGDNTMVFTAVDAAGNTTTRSVTITRVPPPPPTLLVAPAVIAANEATDIILTVGNIDPPGATITITQTFDLDGNGQVDAGEPVVRCFSVTDGAAYDNTNLPADADRIADGAIVTVIDSQFPCDRYHAAGQYVFTVRTATGSDSDSFSVIAVARPQSLQGTIRDEQGAPVAGALVELRDPWARGFGFAMSDAGGGYRFDLDQPGEYLPVPMTAGYLFDRAVASPVAVAAGQAAVRDLLLMTGPRQVTGRVRNAATSAGLAGVLVRAGNDQYVAAAMTSADGSYSLQLRDGDYGLSVETRPGDGLATHGCQGSLLPQRTVKVSGDIPGVDLLMIPGTVLTCGTVATGVDAAASGVPVQALAGGGSGMLAESCSDARGNYCLAFSSGETWQLGLREPTAQGAGLVGTLGTPTSPALTVYPVDAWVVGNIQDESNRPVTGLTVAAGHADGAGVSVVTDGGGRYLLGISSVPTGAWDLVIHGEDSGYVPAASVTIPAVSGQTERRDFTLVKPLLANTIAVTRADYDSRKQVLNVEATSNHANAQLQVDGQGPMTFLRLFKGKYYWALARNLPAPPLAVTVSGPEGAVTVTVR